MHKDFRLRRGLGKHIFPIPKISFKTIMLLLMLLFLFFGGWRTEWGGGGGGGGGGVLKGWGGGGLRSWGGVLKGWGGGLRSWGGVLKGWGGGCEGALGEFPCQATSSENKRVHAHTPCVIIICRSGRGARLQETGIVMTCMADTTNIISMLLLPRAAHAQRGVKCLLLD